MILECVLANIVLRREVFVQVRSTMVIEVLYRKSTPAILYLTLTMLHYGELRTSQ